jgi:hypothetical protein
VRSISPGVLGIKAMKEVLRLFIKFAMSIKVRKDPHDISLDHILAILEESHGEAIRTQSLISIDTFYHL